MSEHKKTSEELKADIAKMRAECDALRQERDALEVERKRRIDRRIKTTGGMHHIAVAIEKEGKSDLTRGEFGQIVINCALGQDRRTIDGWLNAALATELLAAGADLPGGTSRILIKGSKFQYFLKQDS